MIDRITSKILNCKQGTVRQILNKSNCPNTPTEITHYSFYPKLINLIKLEEQEIKLLEKNRKYNPHPNG